MTHGIWKTVNLLMERNPAHMGSKYKGKGKKGNFGASAEGGKSRRHFIGLREKTILLFVSGCR